MSENQKHDFYIALHNNIVTGNSDKKHLLSHKIYRAYYIFGSHTIIYEEQKARKNFSVSCIRIFVFERDELLDYCNSIENVKNNLYDMYVAAQNKLYNRPYTDPYMVK